MNELFIGPQPGPQTAFLRNPADLAIFGGAAGGGKSYALLLDPLRHYHNPNYSALIFRRTTKQVRNKGGLWDQANRLYQPLNPHTREGSLELIFHTGMRVQFGHIEHESNVFDYQGSEIPFIGYDELTHFTEKMFFYLLSRNRSMSGVPGRIRATCNPDPDSWVRTFIDWWIGEDGYPIKERSGKLRWFIRRHDEFIWADTRQQLLDQQAHLSKYDQIEPKSVTFIPSKLEDNKILMEKDPSYRSSLQAMSYVDRMQLLEGNWNVRPAAGMYFKKEWFEIVDAIPAGSTAVRYWDRASTEASNENPDPDYTCGVKMFKSPMGQFFIADMVRFRGTPLKVEAAVKNTASLDGRGCAIGIEQDPGQAGVMEAEYLARQLAGYTVKLNKVQKDKITRASPLSAQCEAGNVKLVRGAWNETFLRELEQFPDGKHDDQVDSCSGAFHLLTDGHVGTFTEDMIKPSGTVRERRELW